MSTMIDGSGHDAIVNEHRQGSSSSRRPAREPPCSSRWERYWRCCYPPAAFTPSSTVPQGWFTTAPHDALFVASEMDGTIFELTAPEEPRRTSDPEMWSTRTPLICTAPRG
jgi:hypothetical protein